MTVKANTRTRLWRAVAAMATSVVVLSVAADALAQPRGRALRAERRLTFNGGALDERGWRVLEQLETLGGGHRLPDGDYWYDAASGVAGRWGGPAAALLVPGLPLGRLPAHASGGGHGRLTGIFVNGRELHPQDVQALIAIYGQAWPGRWWVNGDGDFGREGGVAIGNLRQAAAAARGRSWLRGGDGFWTGGDGNGYVWAMDGYSGCSYASDGGGVIC